MKQEGCFTVSDMEREVRLKCLAEQGDEGLKAWVHHFRELGERLLIRLDQ